MVAKRHIAAKVKNPAFMPIWATYHGKIKAVKKLIPQFAKVAIDIALPRILFGKISPINTQITALIDRAKLAMYMHNIITIQIPEVLPNVN